MARPTVLEITKHEHEYRFRLTRAGQPFSSTKTVWTAKPDAAAVASISRRIEQAVEAAGKVSDRSEPGITPFKDAGRSLFREFLGGAENGMASLRDSLRRLRASLVISTDDPGIFWELLFDDEQNEFFGLRYNMGRQLHAGETSSARCKGSENWRCLLIANPNSDEPEWALPGTAAALRHLRDSLKGRGIKDIHLLEGEQASFDAVLELLDQHEFDIIHYAGHTVAHKKPGSKTYEFALRLHRGVPFSASAIAKHVRGSPVVFLNGCWTGLARGVASPPDIVEGLTDAFLKAGSQLVIGSQFEAPIAGARAFADHFYASVLDGKPVGEAVRGARQQVLKKPEYGAAWACFVMYGDPCLQLKLNVQQDLLQDLLVSAKLRREDFDTPCLRVIEQALDYSGNSDVVATVELFAAMVDSESSWLRDRLDELGAAVETLREAFQSALKEINSSARTKKKPAPTFSPNAQAIIGGAVASAKKDGREKATERDLIASFVVKKGGNVGKILANLKIDVEKLHPDAASAKLPSKKIRIKQTPSGSTIDLRPENFSTEAWAAIQAAIKVATHPAGIVVGTPQLFYGLMLNGHGPLARTVNQLKPIVKFDRKDFGLNGDNGASPTPAGAKSAVILSESVCTILREAISIAQAAGRAKIDERDLLEAFVLQGGGTIGKKLRETGLPLEVLTSQVFLADGLLNPKCFSPSIRVALNGAEKTAEASGHLLIGRSHLIFGMLADAGSLLVRLLVEEGYSPQTLAERIQFGVPKRGGTDIAKMPSVISLGLINVVCLAEKRCRERGEKEISEPCLLVFLLEQSHEIIKKMSIDQSCLRELLRKVRLLL